MSENFNKWKEDLEGRASEIPEPSSEEVNSAVYDTAMQMGDAESINLAERPIEEMKAELEAEGWHFRGPVSGKGVFEAVAEDGKEIRIVGAGTEKFLFEREEK